MLNQKKKKEPERRRPEWATALCEALVATKKVCRDKASWALCRDRLFLVATGCASQAHDRACVHETTQYTRAIENSWLHVATGFSCRDKAGAGTRRPGSRQGSFLL